MTITEETLEIRRRASHQITIDCISSNSKAEHRQCNVLNTMATNNRLLQWKGNRRQDLCSFNDDEYKHFHRERREDLLYYFFKWHLDDVTNRHYQTIWLTEESLQKNLLCQKEKFYKLTRHLVTEIRESRCHTVPPRPGAQILNGGTVAGRPENPRCPRLLTIVSFFRE